MEEIMKIAVRNLHEGSPKPIRETLDPKKLDLEFVDLNYLDTVVLDGTVEKVLDTLTLRGRLITRIAHTCARCLKAVEEPVEHPLEVIYDIKGKEEVDTLEDVREALILNHPLRFLCREECPGLCLQCGADLNEGEHNCPSQS